MVRTYGKAVVLNLRILIGIHKPRKCLRLLSNPKHVKCCNLCGHSRPFQEDLRFRFAFNETNNICYLEDMFL
jgi:hypothetical protein